MQLRIEPTGRVLALYGEAIDLAVLGAVRIRRVSQVEADEAGQWWADLARLGGPRLGPYRLRSEALQGEATWLEDHLFGTEPTTLGLTG